MILKKLRRAGAFFLAAALTMTLLSPAAFADDEGSGGPTTPAAPTITVTLDQTSLTLEKGGTETLTATVTKDGTEVSRPTIVWSSSDTSVATVDTSGNVTTVSAGTATITATYTHTDDNGDSKDYTATCSVTVTKPTATGITLNITNKTLDVKDSVKLTASFLPADAEGTVTWSVEDPTIATVDDSGKVTAVAPGITTVTASLKDKTDATATCEVTVSGLVMEETLEVTVGKSESLKLYRYGEANTNTQSVTWVSSAPSTAGVSGTNGSASISGYYEGTAKITASVGKYSAICTVTVKEDVANAILKDGKAGVALCFEDWMSDFKSAAKDKTKENLSYISSLNVSPKQGVLHYGYVSEANPGAGVGNENYYVTPSVGQLDLSKIYFVPSADFSGTAIIYYTGRTENNISYNGTIRVTVAATNDVRYTTAANQMVRFEAANFSAACQDHTGKDFTSITFAPPSTKKGVLYYNYSVTNVYNPEVDSDVTFYRTYGSSLDNVVFIPAENFTGTVEIPYQCTSAAGSYTGKVTIDVADAEQLGDGKVSYNVTSGGKVTFNVDDFNAVCKNVTGENLNYLYFDLPETGGTLYYNYKSASSYGSRVSATTRYYRTSTPKISLITFVAADNYSGTLSIPFTGYSTGGNSFTGKLTIRVDDANGTVTYRSNYGEDVWFDGADFNELCQSLNGKTLNYVTFELPSASYGTLYREKTTSSSYKVKETTKFYRSGGTYQIEDVVFVPKSGYTGTVEIPFSGYDTSGGRISGTVQIIMERQAGSAVVSYQAVSGGLVSFDVADFNTACQHITGDRLNYVKFTLPASSKGKLYYNYKASSGSGTSVSASTSYYRTGSSNLLDNVSFVVASKYTGTVSIQYSGLSDGGKKYTGTVEIKVNAPNDGTVSYQGSSTPITLKASDFSAVCKEMTGRNLSNIRFTSLPSSTSGTLYLAYESAMRSGTQVKTDTSYYVSGSPMIGEITFVPKAGYQGTVSIPYTATDSGGSTYKGTLKFILSNQYCASTFSDMSGYADAKPSVEFLYASGITKGTGNGMYNPSGNITRSEFIVMVQRAFELEAASGGARFTDVPANTFYTEAVSAAAAAGLVQGYGGKFMPLQTITRQDAMVILLRAMEAYGVTIPNTSTTVLSAYTDGDQVASYARSAVSMFVYLGIADTGSARQLRPKEALTRAEMAVLLHYVLTQ